MKNKWKYSFFLAALWLVAIAAMAASITYAWFSFHPDTNVEPISSTISDGDVALLISNHPEDGFGTECVLPQRANLNYEPVSTSDLVHFYCDLSQDRNGKTVSYKDCSNQYEEKGLYGVLYLKSLKDLCDVYFYRPGMNLGNDAQTLAGARLAIKIDDGVEVKTYIFSLNQMGNTTTAEKRITTERDGEVVGNISGDGTPNYVADPAREIGSYVAIQGSNVQKPIAGSTPLFTLAANRVAKVEYWVYLEGCDGNCINSIQGKEIPLQLSFAGFIQEE